jgi:hypothetical protein
MFRKIRAQINDAALSLNLYKAFSIFFVVIIQLLRLNTPYLMDICFEAISLTFCKYPSDRALGIFFLMG